MVKACWLACSKVVAMASMDTNNKNRQSVLLNELSTLSIFRGLPMESLQPFIEQSEVIHRNKGSILEQPEKPNTHFLIIITGEANGFISALDDMPIMRLTSGNIIGESILLGGDSSPANVIAKTDMRLLSVSPKLMQSFITQSHSVACNMLAELVDRLRAGSKAISHSQVLQERYQKDANIDALTGLYNRRWINAYFKRRLNRSVVSDGFPEMSVVLIDADHFKRFNDDYGHYIGDFALKAIAGAICEHIRPTDLAARYGGEEFMLILPNTSWEEAETVAQRVREGVAQKAIAINGSQYPSISISSGITEAKQSDELSDIIVAADSALYQAKASGRNCVIVDSNLKKHS